MRRSRLAAARAGHVRKRGQPCGRQRNVGSPRGPHLMVSTSMVYGCIIDVFNTENISAECSGEKPPSRPRIPCVYGLEVGVRRRTWLMGIRVPFAVSRLCRERRATLGWVGCVIVALLCPGRISGAFPHHKLPSAYLRERLLVLHLQLLFQGGVEFPTGGKSGGAKGVPWRRRGVCDRADESATRACVGSHAGRTGEIPVPTVRVRMKEAGDLNV